MLAKNLEYGNFDLFKTTILQREEGQLLNLWYILALHFHRFLMEEHISSL